MKIRHFLVCTAIFGFSALNPAFPSKNSNTSVTGAGHIAGWHIDRTIQTAGSGSIYFMTPVAGNGHVDFKTQIAGSGMVGLGAQIAGNGGIFFRTQIVGSGHVGLGAQIAASGVVMKFLS